MKTDRELLELSARAAGIMGPFTQIDPADMRPAFCGIGEWFPGAHLWNPLSDDGDALRLAVKLKMIVDPDGSVYNVSTATLKGTGNIAHAKHGPDPYSATRRAIVLVAAEMVK